MAKYTVNTYGWSFEAICKSLTDEQVQLIREKMDEEGHTKLHEIRFDLDELLEFDIWDGEIFHTTEAFDNGTMRFEILDEEGNKVSEFGVNDISSLYDVIEDYDDKYKYKTYNAVPQYNIPPTNLYLSVDENKGGIHTFTIESDTVPVASDFTVSSGSIDTPDGDYDFIDQVFFKGEPLEIEDYLDNTGKASSCMMFTLDGEDIL